MAIDVVTSSAKVARQMDAEERQKLATKIANAIRVLRRTKARVKEDGDRLETLMKQWESGIVEEDAQPELPLTRPPQPPQDNEHVAAGSEPFDIERPAQPPVDPVEPLDLDDEDREPGTRADGSRPF